MAGVPETEAECALLLASLRWEGGFVCCACGHRRARQVASRPRVFVCRGCAREHRVTAGTVLHGTKVPLRDVFRAVLLLVRHRSVTVRQLAREIGVGNETALSLLGRLRTGLAARPPGLVGEVRLTDLAVGVRGIYDGRELAEHRRSKKKAYPCLIVGTDRQNRAAAVVTTDKWFVPPRLPLAWAGHKDRPSWPQFGPVAAWVRTVLHDVHRTVSPRWLEVYACALCAVQTLGIEGRDLRDGALAAALACPSRGYRHLRPPENRWDPSWRMEGVQRNHVRLDRLEFPIRPSHRIVLRRGGVYRPPSDG